MATSDEIIAAYRSQDMGTRLEQWQSLIKEIQMHIDRAYMLGEAHAILHLRAMKADPSQVEKAQKEAAYWRNWYKEAYRRMTPKQRRGD